MEEGPSFVMPSASLCRPPSLWGFKGKAVALLALLPWPLQDSGRAGTGALQSGHRWMTEQGGRGQECSG